MTFVQQKNSCSFCEFNARTTLVEGIERGLTMKRTMMGAPCLKSSKGQPNKLLRRIFLLVVVSAFAFAICPDLYGQATGSFSGNVVDKSGSSVAGATVTATSQGTGLARDVKTDSVGHYLIPLLPVGIYTVRVDFTNFDLWPPSVRSRTSGTTALDNPRAERSLASSTGRPRTSSL